MISNVIDSLKRSTVLKLFLILIILLLLLIPLELVKGVIHERFYSNNKVSDELSQTWGKTGEINGPFMIIPYESPYTEVNMDKTINSKKVINYVHVLPKSLELQSEVNAEELKRSIYKTIVYQSKNIIKGSFAPVDISSIKDLEKTDNLLLDNIEITLGVNDLMGIKKLPVITINGNAYKLSLRKRESGSAILLSAVVPVKELLAGGFNFELDFELNGSKQLIINPVAEENTISVKGNWPDPSFKGSYITLDKKIDKNGFEAKWEIPKLLNETPTIFTGTAPVTTVIDDSDPYVVKPRLGSSINSSHYIEIYFFDVENNYTKSEKIVKYAVLVIILTFVSIFLSEIYSKERIHVVNYLLIGLGIVIFYLLLLSISEFLNFDLSYIIAGLATILLISSFIRMLVPNKNVSLAIGFILALLYTFIYMLIQLQEHALLVGSIGLFVILAILMRFSAKYKLGFNE